MGAEKHDEGECVDAVEGVAAASTQNLESHEEKKSSGRIMTFRIRDIEFKRPNFYAVIGRRGSGKTHIAAKLAEELYTRGRHYSIHSFTRDPMRFGPGPEIHSHTENHEAELKSLIEEQTQRIESDRERHESENPNEAYTIPLELQVCVVSDGLDVRFFRSRPFFEMCQYARHIGMYVIVTLQSVKHIPPMVRVNVDTFMITGVLEQRSEKYIFEECAHASNYTREAIQNLWAFLSLEVDCTLVVDNTICPTDGGTNVFMLEF